MKISVIFCACQQGDWVRWTIPRAKESLSGTNYELIVVDDQSTDGCCHDLPKDVLIVRTDHREGVSGARRLGAEAADGDVIIYSDPHTHYPGNTLAEIARMASDTPGIVCPCSIQPLVDRIDLIKSRYPFRACHGGHLITSERGLRIKTSKHKASDHPALLGATYAIRRDVHRKLDGWPRLPGVWGCSEQAMSLLCWFSETPIVIADQTASDPIWHMGYQPNGKFPYHTQLVDEAANRHYVHRAFFPNSYKTYWRWVLWAKYGYRPKHWECLSRNTKQGRYFWRFRRHVSNLSKRSESDFWQTVLGRELPRLPSETADPDYIRRQKRRSKPRENKGVHPRVRSVVQWAVREMPGCIKGRSILDVGARDGWMTTLLKEMGARAVQGVELIEVTAEFAQMELGRSVRPGDMRHLPDSDCTWDVVTAIHSLEHVPDARTAFDELVRVCKVGGWIIIAVPKESERTSPDRTHMSFWDSLDKLVKWVHGNPYIDPFSIKSKEKRLRRRKPAIELRLMVQKDSWKPKQ